MELFFLLSCDFMVDSAHVYKVEFVRRHHRTSRRVSSVVRTLSDQEVAVANSGLSRTGGGGTPSLNRQTCAVWFRTDRNAGSIPALARIFFPFLLFECGIDLCQRPGNHSTTLCSLCMIMWSILTVLGISLVI